MKSNWSRGWNLVLPTYACRKNCPEKDRLSILNKYLSSFFRDFGSVRIDRFLFPLLLQERPVADTAMNVNKSHRPGREKSARSCRSNFLPTKILNLFLSHGFPVICFDGKTKSRIRNTIWQQQKQQVPGIAS